MYPGRHSPAQLHDYTLSRKLRAYGTQVIEEQLK